MNKVIKITTALIICSLPLSTLATDCDPDDIKCQKLEAMREAGIKETTLVKPKSSFDNNEEQKKPAKKKPYTIPTPTYNQPPKQDQQTKKKEEKYMPFNIFAPKSTNPNKADSSKEKKFKFRKPTPLQPNIIKKSSGIYQ